MIRGKIDVTKIDKTRLFQGQKGKYLNITMFETPDDKFGNDYRIVQDVGREAREAGEKGAILGNAKVFDRGGAAPSRRNDDDDVTF